MEIPLHILIGSIFGLIILSAFFSGSETSLTSASKPRMHNLARTGKKNAKLSRYFYTVFCKRCDVRHPSQFSDCFSTLFWFIGE